MVHQYQRMLQRNLLYTAVTRSKDLLILLGEEQAYLTCVKNETASRMTTLKRRIEENDSMTLVTRTKLTAYEDSLAGNDPFEDGSYTSEVSEKVVKTAKKEERTVSNKKEVRNEFVVEEVPLFETQTIETEKEVASNEQPKTYILTNEAIENQTIDPMIGMEKIRLQ